MKFMHTSLAGLLVISLLTAACAAQHDSASPDASTASTATPTSGLPTSTTIATTTSAPRSVGQVFTSYEFPSGLIDGGIDGRPSQVQGLLGVPEGTGPFPLAIVMHGSHPPCVDDFIPEAFSEQIVTETVEYLCGTDFPEYIRHDIGLGHIVAALNDVGVAAISIDVDSAYVWWGGEPNELSTIEGVISAHLDVLTRLNDGDATGLEIASVAGRLDLDSISVVGHSRSGGHIASMMDGSRDLIFNPVAAVMIEPAVGAPVTDYLDIPLLHIRGECDEDVGPDAARQFLLDTVPADRSSRVTDMFIPAAGHRSLNTGLNGSTCPDQGDRTATQSQVAHAVASFITTQGEEVAILEDVDATVEALIGPPPTLVATAASIDFDPQSVPLASSQTELLPALPPGADYADALIEDF